MTRLACDLAGQPYRLSVAPGWLLKLLSLAVQPIRENQELMYQLDRDYRFSSKKIEAALGLAATPYADGVTATLASAI